MREPALNSTFPVTQCANCGRAVLTYVFLNSAGEDQRACVHCDTPAGSELRWVTAAELADDGYEIGARSAPRAGGCGGGCTCSAPRPLKA